MQILCGPSQNCFRKNSKRSMQYANHRNLSSVLFDKIVCVKQYAVKQCTTLHECSQPRSPEVRQLTYNVHYELNTIISTPNHRSVQFPAVTYRRRETGGVRPQRVCLSVCLSSPVTCIEYVQSNCPSVVCHSHCPQISSGQSLSNSVTHEGSSQEPVMQ